MALETVKKKELSSIDMDFRDVQPETPRGNSNGAKCEGNSIIL